MLLERSVSRQPAERFPDAKSTGKSGPVAASTPLPADYSRLISEISARMVKVSNEELDAEILQTLQKALQPLGVDRGGLLEVWEDSPVVRVAYAWYADGVDQVSGEVNLAELFPFSYRQLVDQGRILIIDRLADLPPEAEVDRQSHLSMGVKSVLNIPIFIGRRVHHLLAVQALKSECNWPEEVVAHLRLLGEIFVSALQRREADRALRNTKERLNLAAESADAGLWDLDLQDGTFWITEKIRQLFNFAPEWEPTLENFLMVIHDDDRELIRKAIDTACRSGEETNVEYRFVSKDGSVRWMGSRGRLHADEVSGQRRLMGITLDITKRKLMEQQLQEQLGEIEHLRKQLEAENAYLRNEMAIRSERRNLHNLGSCMQEVMAKASQVADTGSTVLIQGETGTGKEVLAQEIHRLSARGKRVMVKVNCAALPAALVESELFGREKGAFTGALSRQPGRFELADGSTLFLDEIAEMPLETQAKLLRVLQEGEFERLGSPRTIKVDVRVIAASNRDLAAEVEQGRFRRDLFYRLNVFPIQLPPLRERQEEIPHLVWEFVNEFGERMGKKIRRIASRDMEQLQRYAWPGNIRELRNVIEHALIVSKGETLELQRLIAAAPHVETALTLEEVERRHIQEVLKATRGRVKGAGGAAETLGLNPSTLYSRMLKLGIHPARA